MINIGVVGAGHWGKNLVRTFNSIKECRLKYVCDLNLDLRSGIARQYPLTEVTDNYDVMLEDGELDAVVVAVDAPLHFELGKKALEKGKHTYIEKPMTLDVVHAEQLVSLAEKGKRKLMVGHLLEYHPCVDYLKTMIADALIGDTLYLYFQRLNLGIIRNQENAWWSLAPHDISVACYLFDSQPVSVSVSGQAYLQPGIEDVVFASLKFADGRMAHIHVSWLDPHKIRKITLVGSKKMATFDDMDSAEKIRIYDKGAVVSGSTDAAGAVAVRSGDIVIPKVVTSEPLMLECRHFIDSIVNDTVPRSDGRDGLRVVKVLAAGAESLKSGGPLVEIA